MTDSLLVSVDIDRKTVVAGRAFFSFRGSLSTSFQYDLGYLRLPGAYELDPALPIFRGQHHVSGLPGAFRDAAPDRWGRNLIRKRHIAETQKTGDMRRELTDVDYLLGVSDITRQGALRFSRAENSEYLDIATEIPKTIELPALLRAADAIGRGEDDFRDIKILLGAGTATLGGARPKASVRDGDRLCIAKFPHQSDEWNVLAWEKTALDLAARAGIPVPTCRLTLLDGRGVLILDRFDRGNDGRIGYLSAMSVLQARDGDHHDYLDLAEALLDISADADADLLDLWRRMVFHVAIHNTDDHLRNHGFLRVSKGWRLAPIFDINPNPDTAESRTTSIGGATSPAEELDALLDIADTFAISRQTAETILSEVFTTTESWRHTAVANGVPECEIRRFHGAFESLRSQVAQVTNP